MPVTRDEFRDAMARLGAAVNIITTAGAAGRAGTVASAVCSVTDDPPLLLLCLNRTSSLHAPLRANGILCVNTLLHGQRDLSDVFSGRGGLTGEQRFAHGVWGTLATGAPVLADAGVCCDCTIADVVEKGTHSVFFCAVQAVQLGVSGRGLIWHGRGYHPVGDDSPS